jgi:hypothetical protein
MNQPTFRDVEQLSAYLDGQLPPAEAARLETRLKTDPQLHAVYTDLSQSRALLRQLPARRAPRNFTLTPKMAGVKPPLPRSFPLFRFASALATLLFLFSLTVNSLPAFPSLNAAAPAAYGMGGPAPLEAPAAAAAAATEAPAATAAPAALLPAAPLPAQEAAPTAEAQRLAEPTLAADQAQAKIAPGEPAAQPPAAEPAFSQPRIPGGVLWGLLLLAVLAGSAALLVRWQAEQAFARRQK